MNPSDADASLIAHVIQLSVAPVFLISGVGSLLGVMTGRLARVLDRARSLEGLVASLAAGERAEAIRELGILSHRAHLASWAINWSAFSALFICLVVATLFIDAFMGTHLRWFVSAQFVFAMFALVAGLVCFLREVYLATHTLKIGSSVAAGIG